MDQCPKPSCDEPVLAPNRCCKVCPGEIESSRPDVIDEPPPPAREDEGKNLKHYASVLTSKYIVNRDRMSEEEGAQYKATGRFMFHKRNLYYSFYSTSRPSRLQFMDPSGSIIEEQVLMPTSPYQNDTDKVCGVWRRLPRDYRKLLREEKLHVALLWEHNDMAITGQLYRYSALSTELFSALLDGPSGQSAGTAIVSVSTQLPSIHMTLVFTGIFNSNNTADIPVAVKLQSSSSKERIIMEEIVRVEKPSQYLNVIEVRSPVSSTDLKQLSRQRLVVTVSAASGMSVSGQVRPRVSCELLQSPIGPSSDGNTSGMAWMYIDKSGSLKYFVRLHGIDHPDLLGLVIERRLVELEDLTPSFHHGWANGTVEQISTRHLEQLYGGELAVNVATTETQSLMKGRLSGRPVADANNVPAPSLFLETDDSEDKIGGMIWAAVDIDCVLHYEVVLSGEAVESLTMGLYLEEVPLAVRGAPVSHRFLEEFNGHAVEGFVLGLSITEMNRLNSGVVHFSIRNLHTSKSILKAHWRQVFIPGVCLSQATDSDNNVPSLDNFNSDVTSPERTSCFYAGAFHEEGTQWHSKVEPCTMCHCHHSVVSCQSFICPPLTCTNPTFPPGQCCPTCTNPTDSDVDSDSNKVSKGCTLADQVYAVGTSWHPYLIPNGFDNCTICTCNGTKPSVDCKRTKCPPLDCDDDVAVHKAGCCKVCPEVVTPRIPGDPNWVGDMESGVRRTKTQILAAGGCSHTASRVYENGEQWHPKIPYIGESKAVTCLCKDGSVKCERQKLH